MLVHSCNFHLAPEHTHPQKRENWNPYNHRLYPHRWKGLLTAWQSRCHQALTHCLDLFLLPYCLPPLAFSSLASNLSTCSSLAIESSKNSLLCWPTLIGKWLQMRRRPEIRELQLKLQSGRGKGIGHCTSVMLDSGSWCACMQDVHQYIIFLYWILVDNNSWLFIYLFTVALLFVSVGGRAAEKQGSAWVITQKKLCWEYSSHSFAV